MFFLSFLYFFHFPFHSSKGQVFMLSFSPEKICNNTEGKSCSQLVPFKAPIFLKTLRRLGWISHENLEVEKFKKKDGFSWSRHVCSSSSFFLSAFGLGEDNFKRDIYLDLGLPMIARNHVRYGNIFTSRLEVGSPW